MEVLKNIVINSKLKENVGIRIDYVVLTSHVRFEILFAANVDNENRVYILELLAWENVQATENHDLVICVEDEKIDEVLHPSYQSICYKGFIEKNLSVIGDMHIKFSSGVFLYECQKTIETDICSTFEIELLNEAPVFYVDEEKNCLRS